jgi:hypothetical protein
MTDKEWLELLQSKEAHRLAISAGVGAATGGWGFLAALLGFKVWDKAAPGLQKELQKDREMFGELATNDFWSKFRKNWNQSGGK